MERREMSAGTTTWAPLDVIARLVAGPVTLAVGLARLSGVVALGVPFSVLAGVFGVVSLATGPSRRCPPNDQFDVDTRQR
jgi:hypothetical protein